MTSAHTANGEPLIFFFAKSTNALIGNPMNNITDINWIKSNQLLIPSASMIYFPFCIKLANSFSYSCATESGS